MPANQPGESACREVAFPLILYILLNHMKGIFLAAIGPANLVLYNDSSRTSTDNSGLAIQQVKRPVIRSKRSTALGAYNIQSDNLLGFST